MDPETRRRIEETVIDVLQKSNMEEMTEYKVRAAAAEQLGIDLSGMECKWVVRNVVDNFLLSIMKHEDKGKEEGTGPIAPDHTKAVVQEIIPKKEINDDGSRLICQLSENRSVTVHDFRGRTMVSIRQYYEKDGKQLPSAKGISLPTEQWSAFRSSIPAIEKAISQMKRRLRFVRDAEKIDAVSDSTTEVTPPNFPIKIIRFDGKNYHVWAHQMEFLLQHLKIAHVLFDSCPTAVLGPGSSSGNAAQSMAAKQKWMNDDHMCRHNILNSLSDSLFHQYTKRTMSARELWEELKLLHLFEEFGTKRTQVEKYVKFRLAEEKSILEQVQELNSISNSIVAAGMWIDEDFHVSVIISKLPSSWKNVWIKLMQEDPLPLWKLMDRLKIEEELRTQQNSHLSGASSNPVGRHPAPDHISKMGDPKLTSPQFKRKERQVDNKSLLCFDCGKEGHISRNCLSRKVGNEVTRERT